MSKINKLFLFVFLAVFSQTLFSQERIIKDYADTCSRKDYCFYPSTLRMINLVDNQDYNKMIQDIEKILVYDLDSTAIADKSYLIMLSDYVDVGYEELAVMIGGSTNLYIYLKEDKSNIFVGVFKDSEKVYSFYLQGNIGLQKILGLFQTIREGDLFNLFDLTSNYAGKNPEN